MNKMKRYRLRIHAAFLHLVTLGRFKYSLPTEGNVLTMSEENGLWWSYKFYGHPIREPEEGKGIREYFRQHPPADFFAGLSDGQRPSQKSAEPHETTEPHEPASFSDSSPGDVWPAGDATITFGGDILPTPSLRADTAVHLWDDVEDFFFNADIRYANLESPVVKDLPLGYPTELITESPRINNTAEALALCTRGGTGITIFSTANNHSLDHGPDGLLATLDLLDEMGIEHTGTAHNPQERDAFPILEAGGIKVAFLSWTFSFNDKTLPEGCEYLANALRLNVPEVDLSAITQQIQQARLRGADVVAACLHWGLENEAYPLASQIETAHRIIEAGADIIVGNHAHSLQPAERYVYQDDAGEEREGLILYALGDLISALPRLGFAALAALARVRLVRQSNGRVVIHTVRIKPIYAYRHFEKRRLIGASSEERDRVSDMRVLDFANLKRRLRDGDLKGDPVLDPTQVRALRKLIPLQEDLMPFVR
jgi:poly-gamma-glutamate synthesis protein (capsule biosynthesis protein)